MGSASRHSETDYAQVISEKIFVSGASSQNVRPAVFRKHLSLAQRDLDFSSSAGKTLRV
jgi:hypothetical protein